MPISRTAEQFLEQLAKNLDISDTRYQAAARSYGAVGQWLRRPESRLSKFTPSIYPQGSFRLGTVIGPASGQECYDLDVVCEVNQAKQAITQEQLKRHLGTELQGYAEAHGMAAPVAERYCWTLNYADGAQFQMDLLPAVPDALYQEAILRARGLSHEWVNTAIGITDTEDPQYRVICQEWSPSNPRGFASWFQSRMKTAFEARRQAILLAEGRSHSEPIPEYRIKTPLQSAVQILKRHRDLTFDHTPDLKPTSIVLTTLAAHAYREERTIADALYAILAGMDQYIEDRDRKPWIPNPSDPRENFADRWIEQPELQASFREWLDTVRADFNQVAASTDFDSITDLLAPRLGRSLMEKLTPPEKVRHSRIAGAVRHVLDAPHRQPPKWPLALSGSVQISKATMIQNGRQQSFASGSAPIPKRCDLRFDAETSINGPLEVYWQVVNTGPEAMSARGLRGSFEPGRVETGQLTRRESTLYAGTHSIECFIVKHGYCVARSGPFIVSVQ